MEQTERGRAHLHRPNILSDEWSVIFVEMLSGMMLRYSKDRVTWQECTYLQLRGGPRDPITLIGDYGFKSFDELPEGLQMLTTDAAIHGGPAVSALIEFVNTHSKTKIKQEQDNPFAPNEAEPIHDSLDNPIDTASKPGQKFDSGKVRWDLMPWTTLEEVARVMEHGATKYGVLNYKTVPGWRRRYFSAAMRHLVAWARGEKRDPDSGLLHLAHAICCVLMLLDQEIDCAPSDGFRNWTTKFGLE